MTRLKVSEMPEADVLAGDELIGIVQAGISRKLVLSNLGSRFAGLASDNTFTGEMRLEQSLTLEATNGKRQPFRVSVNMDGSAMGATDATENKVGQVLGINWIGGFTAEGGYEGLPDPYFLNGADDYFLTGTTEGDVDGVTTVWGRLTEVHVRTPNADLDEVRSLVVQSYIDEASAHVGTITALVVDGPSGEGSTDLAVTALFVSPTTGDSKWNLHALGGAESLFEGHVNLDDTTLNTHDGAVASKLLLVGPDGTADGEQAHATFRPQADRAAIDVIQNAAQTANLAQIRANNGAPLWRILPSGGMVTSVGSAPADGDLAANDMCIWFDHTDGAAKLKIKAKSTNGSVVAGEVALA